MDAVATSQPIPTNILNPTNGVIAAQFKYF